MLKKVFILDIFGRSYDWTEKYIDNCNTLEKYGWNWLIVTDQDTKGRGNVKVVPMDIKALEYLIRDKIGIVADINAKMRVDGRAVGEFHPAFGLIFSEYIQDYEFWGYTNNDVIYGRLDRFCSDEFLKDIDIFGNDKSDDITSINGSISCGGNEQMNGAFSLLRNSYEVNHLFEKVQNWKEILSGNGYTAFDERIFSPVVIEARDSGKLRVEFRGWRESDRNWADHAGSPKIQILEDGTLLNTVTKKEIMMFHFGRTKRWCV